MENLRFLQTWSVDEFKANNKLEKIQIKKNENTGKYFFQYGYETGPCSKKIATGELTMPVISQVCDANTGDLFFMLHQRGENRKVSVLLSL